MANENAPVRWEDLEYYDKKLDEVTAKLKAEIASHSNPNLLINPNLREPINQRGQSEYTSQGYTIDCWWIFNHCTLIVEDDGITLTAGTSETYVRRKLEQRFDGMALTLSIKTSSGVYSGTGVASASVPSTDNQVIAVTADGAYFRLYKSVSGSYFIQYTIPANVTVKLEWIKLELGSAATPFVPPDPAAELARCQRYYQIRTTGDIDPADLRPSMRIAPTVTQLDDGNYAYSAEL